MTGQKFRKKPVVIEAMQFDGSNGPAVEAWAGGAVSRAGDRTLTVQTPEGPLFARSGDWIVRGVWGEIYPVFPGIFQETYEAVTDEEAGSPTPH